MTMRTIVISGLLSLGTLLNGATACADTSLRLQEVRPLPGALDNVSDGQ